MPESNLVIGIDGGGTATRAVVATCDGVVLGTAVVAGCNCQNVGIATAVERIGAAARGAFQEAERPFELPAAMFVGAAGVRTDDQARLVASAIAAAGLARRDQLKVANDCENAHAAGLHGRSGVALICGTGSIALGRGVDGRSFFCGGWGWLLDDTASGAWLGLQALRAIVRGVDGRGTETVLRAAILETLQLRDVDALAEYVYGDRFGAAEFARLAPVVMRAAQDGDNVALAILQHGAAEAAMLVRGAARGAGLTGAVEVVPVGGAARSGAPYQPMIEAAIRRLLPTATIIEPTLPASLGAVLRALELAGVTITNDLIDRLKPAATAATSHA